MGPGDGGAVQWMKVLWPFGVALRGEASNRLMLRLCRSTTPLFAFDQGQ